MNLQIMIDSFRRASVHSLLIISFEDAGLKLLVEREMPGLEVTQWTKANIAGLGLGQLYSMLRQRKWDGVLVSTHQSTVNRSRSSIELLVSFARTSQRWIRRDSENFIPMTAFTIAFSVLPRLFVALAGGALSIIGLYALIGMIGVRPALQKNRLSKRPEKETVLFIRSDLPGPVISGGSASHLKGMMNAFVAAGFRVAYVGDARLEFLPAEITQYTLKPISFLEVFDEFQIVAYNIQLFFHARKICGSIRPTLIYHRHGVLSIAGALLARTAGVPFVLEANASEVWVKRNWSRLFFEDLAVRCERLSIQHSDCLSAISQGVLRMLESYRPDPAKVLVNPNGIDPREFHAAIDGSAIRAKYALDRYVTIGFIGSFARWHGVETLVEAALLTIRKESKARFLLVGDGDLRSQLEARVQQSHGNDSVIFTGRIPHREAPAYLSACDILVSPHIGFEDGTSFFGSPTKLFEYMALAKPVIASDIEQIGEIIKDGVNGLTIEPGNPVELSEKIRRLINDETLRKALGSQAYKDVMAHYTWSKNVERILKQVYC